MSLIWFDHYIVGLSSDTKPATHPNTGMPLDMGWSFLETDTNNLFMYIGMWQSCVNISGASATALLDVFTSTFKGVVPASGGGTLNFLRADGTFAVPGGGGSVESHIPLVAVATEVTF